MEKIKITIAIILIFCFVSWGKILVVVSDDGFSYKVVQNCEVTIYDEEGEIVFYGYTNVHGRVQAKNLSTGSYNARVRVFSRRHNFDLEIENPEGIDTLFIPVQRH
ncbi:hypothetical protein CHISP_1064 [Chitinispirillum alkaliphilum]|nr:hypothetical protein CHISP_1064 [Chitinispirillum alkaliphilum]